MLLPLFIAHDPGETLAHTVTVRSAMAHAAGGDLAIFPLVEAHLRGLDLYRRRHVMRAGQLYEADAGIPLSTGCSLARFCAPALAQRLGLVQPWIIYCDGDMLWRRDPLALLDLADDRCACMVVKHPEWSPEATKKNGALQRAYPRKAWSSLTLWNMRHPANVDLLDGEAVNGAAPDWLQGFRWLRDDQLGALPPEWNWLAGVSAPVADPAIVHYTLGAPDRGGMGDAPFAGEWRAHAET